MPYLADFYRRNFTYLLILVLAGMLLYAFSGKLLNDDAFISFRYAKNLVDGHGLVWNPGERLEGYSNFLWVMAFAAGMKIGIPPEKFVYLISIPIYLAALILTYLLALRIINNRTMALAALLLVGFNHSVARFAGCGLETPLQMLLFVLTGYVIYLGVHRGWSIKRTLTLSMILNTAMLTRPDSVVLIAGAAIAWLLTCRDKKLADYIALLAPFLAITLPYLVWKQLYYGTIIPNAFNVKVRDLSGIGFGFYYFYLFVIYYGLIPFLALVIWRGKSLFRKSRAAGFMMLLTLVWFCYVISVGGDFMEFRFMVPIIPFLTIIILLVLHEYLPDKRLIVALTLVLCIGTVNNFWKFYNYRVERAEELVDHLYAPAENWVAIGKRLKELFEGTDVRLGVCAAGAIPYYSELNCVDLIGLADRHVPFIGEEFSTMPGHRIIAPLEYIVNREVNIVVQPINLMMNRAMFQRWYRLVNWAAIYPFFIDIDKPVNGKIMNEVYLVALPIENGYILIIWYLTPHKEVDRVIEELGLRKIRLQRPRYG
ncbi:hypothetical protein HQ587_09665 [bacterium]|nr:hypothetical protein [bacterium]